MSFYDPAPPANFEILQSCFRQAELTNELPLAWKLIRDARALDIVGQFRRAVIDAGAGAEIAMPVLIDSLLPTGLKPKLRKQLMYGTLGRLWGTLRDSGYSRKADIKTDLVDARNTATHKSGSTLAGDASEKAIGAAAELVEAAFPLPDGMERLW